MPGDRKNVFLEVNPTILEEKLLVKGEASGKEDYEALFGLKNNTHEGPWKLVTPSPGFCVKTFDKQRQKVFINICTVPDIPEPKDITEEELVHLIENEDGSEFRVPLSLQEPRDDVDKSGCAATVYDVAINPKFFAKIQKSEVFRTFLLQVVMDGLKDKYDVELECENYILLKNRKCVGELRPHRIRTTPTPVASSSDTASKKLIQEVAIDNLGEGKKGFQKEVDVVEYRFLKKNEKGKDYLIGQFYLPKVVSNEDVSLEVGMDRVILICRGANYYVDVFLPLTLDSNMVYSEFSSVNKLLMLWVGICQ